MTDYGWDSSNAWRTSQGPDSNPTQIQYTYNGAGLMATYANSATQTNATYTYDAAGQRTESVVDVNGTTTTTNWIYDSGQLLSMNATQGSSSWRIDYLYDENGTPYGGVYREPANSTAPVYFSMLTDSRGDVLELLDSNGESFGGYRYDAWGLPTGTGNLGTGIWTASTTLVNSTLAGQIAGCQALRCAGYVYDSESGLYYLTTRYYDPATRQFTTADSAKADGEESAYQYCSGDPVGQVDPSGEAAYKKCNVSITVEWKEAPLGTAWRFTPYAQWQSNGQYLLNGETHFDIHDSYVNPVLRAAGWYATYDETYYGAQKVDSCGHILSWSGTYRCYCMPFSA